MGNQAPVVGDYPFKATKTLMICSRMHQRYNRRMEDPEKVAAKKAELNSSDDTKAWDDVVGFHIMSTLNLSTDGAGGSVDPGTGVAVKAFINTTTGEVKLFWAKNFFRGQNGN